MSKLCPGVWCPNTIFFATVAFLFISFFGFLFVLLSLDLLFNTQIDEIGYRFYKPKSYEVDVIPGGVISIEADEVDKSNEGKLVYLSGNTTTDDISTDPLFGLVVSNVIKLRRVVDKFEEKGWSKSDSPLNSETFMPKLVKLGAFTLSSGLIDKMRHYQWLPMTEELFEQIPDNLSSQLNGKLHLNNGNYYVGQDPAHPQIGDLRIRFFVVSTETVSVIAKQVGLRLVPYHDIELLKYGAVSVEEVISTHSREIISAKTYYFSQFRKRLPLYFLVFFPLSFGIYLTFLMLSTLSNFPPAWSLKRSSGFIIIENEKHFLPIMIGILIMIGIFIVFLVLLLGIYVILFLLSKLLKYIPFFDKIINQLNWLSLLIITVSLFLIIIASIWISYLPMLGVTLIVMAVCSLYFLKFAHRLLKVPNFELPEPTRFLIPETVVPQKDQSSQWH